MRRSWQTMKDGTKVYLYAWLPDEVKIKGIVHVVHGMAEHALRYEHFAWRLCEQGYAVYAHDHRGHGQSAKGLEHVGDIANESFDVLADDVESIRRQIMKEYDAHTPYFVFGHSMGSFISLRYAEKYGQAIHGLILCGSNGKPNFLINVGILIANMQINYYGYKHRSKLIDQLTFGGFNKRFRPNRTAFDWLSQDEKKVDEYVSDPYCGFVCTTSFYRSFFTGLNTWFKAKEIRKIPHTLPIHLIHGDEDPVGEFGKGVERLEKQLKQAGIQTITRTTFPKGRHELLNDLDANAVIDDIVNWLDRH